MGKYEKLHDYLSDSDESEVSLSFEQIGQLVGGLPNSAYNPKYSWWANEHSPRRVHASAWRSAGYEATADWGEESVVFRRSADLATAPGRINKPQAKQVRAGKRHSRAALAVLKRQYYSQLDRSAVKIADRLTRGKPVTLLILKSIRELYVAARSGSVLRMGDRHFEAAYHPPISSDLEFLIARVLYHYSRLLDLGWIIFLRRQVRKMAPDVRIELDGQTLAVIEVKAKAGWAQTIFSDYVYALDMRRYEQGKGEDPALGVKRFRDQCSKYYREFQLTKDRVFVLLPSLVLVHRKKSAGTIRDYEATFRRNTELSEHSLILLSSNLLLDLSSDHAQSAYRPTNRLERFIRTLHVMPGVKT